MHTKNSASLQPGVMEATLWQERPRPAHAVCRGRPGPAGLGSTLVALCPVSWVVRRDSTGAFPMELCQAREFALGRAGDRALHTARARKGLWAPRGPLQPLSATPLLRRGRCF